MSRPLLLLGAVLAGCATAAGACSAENQPDDASATATGSGALGGASSAGGGGQGGSFAATGGGGSGVGGGCVGVSSTAEPLPLDIFIMLDQSGSMSLDSGNALSRWETVKAALGAFVKLPNSDGIGVGIQYFGLPDPTPHGCTQQTCATDADCTGGCTVCMPQGLCQAPFNPDIDSCEAVDYAWADVAIQELPGAANSIIASIGAHTPGTNTPSLPALQGALDYAKAWKEAHPDHVTVVAFATDGEPSECDTDPTHVNMVASVAYNGVPSIPTYVIGVGPALQLLDDVAAAGGTTTAFHVDVDPNATDLFLQAMNTIRLAAIGCTYEIPPAPPNMMLDFDFVNVEYTPGSGDPSEQFPKVAGKVDCVDEDGWYYDDNANPTKIILCPATCEKLGKDLKAQLDIVLGCQTILK